jgi:hypothetical protein
MGFIWVAGIMGYGVATTLVGRYRTSLGFALLTAAQILASNALGIFAGEWKNTSAATERLLVEGATAIVISAVVVNLGGLFCEDMPGWQQRSSLLPARRAGG